MIKFFQTKTLFLGFLSLGIFTSTLQADEHLFGYVKGAETLPKNKAELYQFITLRQGKPNAQYSAWDFDTEYEYGFTDDFQADVSVKQHYITSAGLEGIDSGSFYKFAGVELGFKYRFNSIFKDDYGLAIHGEIGYLGYDDVGSLPQKELFIASHLIYQKNFFDDTLIYAANIGAEFAFGKQPAEEYNEEVSFEASTGLSYRIMPAWFLGVEANIRSEFPDFDLSNHEHTRLFVGPNIHFGGEKFWGTFSWVYQVWGKGVDEDTNQTFAEEVYNEFKLKLGFNL